MKLLEIHGEKKLETAELLLSILKKAKKAKKLWFMDTGGKTYRVIDVEKQLDRIGTNIYFTVVKLDIPEASRSTPNLRLIRMDMLSKFWELKKVNIEGENRLVLQKKPEYRV